MNILDAMLAAQGGGSRQRRRDLAFVQAELLTELPGGAFAV